MSWVTWESTTANFSFDYGAITLFGKSFQIFLLPLLDQILWSRNPPIAPCGIIGVWAPPFSLAATGGINYCSLFLRLIRCFSSARTLLYPMYSDKNSQKIGRVNSFGNLWIKASLAAPQSLSQLCTSFVGTFDQGIRRMHYC